MNPAARQSWWREVGAICRGLDFIQGGGGILAAEPRTATTARRTRPIRFWLARLLRNLSYLGGRPMHAGHNGDTAEPFESPSRDIRTTTACPHC